MLPVGWTRDLMLLFAVGAAGFGLGAAVGHAGLGLAAGILAFMAIGFRRLARLHHWIVAGLPAEAPPVHGGMLGDIADRVQHQQSRLQREVEQLGDTITRLRDSYSALRDGIVILGADSSIEWFNQSACRLLGLRHPEDVGRQLTNLVRNPEFVAFLGADESAADFEFALAVPHGPVLQVQAAAFGASSKVLFVRDVTSLRQMETIRRDFVTNISHELRTPLTVISGYLDTLADLLPTDSPALARALAQMGEQAVRMERLLKDLLLLARFEGASEVRPEHVAVDSLLTAARESALASCGGTRRIDVACDPGVVLLADRLQFESIVGNLVFNAVQYTRPGGNIRIEFRREGGELVFCVRDDGIGIDPAHIPRLTERFYRVDKSRSMAGGGTGLGLAIVKHALHRLGGRLEIESRPGAGSSFLCRLPVALLAST